MQNFRAILLTSDGMIILFQGFYKNKSGYCYIMRKNTYLVYISNCMFLSRQFILG